MTKQLSPPLSDYQGGGPVVPIKDRGEPGVPRISILMCWARNDGSVRATRVRCIYWLKAQSVWRRVAKMPHGVRAMGVLEG